MLISTLALSANDFNSKKGILGTWLIEAKDAKAEIYLEKDGTASGKIIWMLNPIDEETGKEKRDKKNPDKSLRTRPVQDLVFIYGFHYDADKDEWLEGTIYDPKTGKTYRSSMWIEEDKLQLRGYIGWFFKTQTWTRDK